LFCVVPLSAALCVRFFRFAEEAEDAGRRVRPSVVVVVVSLCRCVVVSLCRCVVASLCRCVVVRHYFAVLLFVVSSFVFESRTSNDVDALTGGGRREEANNEGGKGDGLVVSGEADAVGLETRSGGCNENGSRLTKEV